MRPAATKLCTVALCGLLAGCSVWRPWHSSVPKGAAAKASSSSQGKKSSSSWFHSDQPSEPQTVNQWLRNSKPVRLPAEPKD